MPEPEPKQPYKPVDQDKFDEMVKAFNNATIPIEVIHIADRFRGKTVAGKFIPSDIDGKDIANAIMKAKRPTRTAPEQPAKLSREERAALVQKRSERALLAHRQRLQRHRFSFRGDGPA